MIPAPARPYLDILKLVWPLALGMVNNAVMQFVDRAYLAHESMASLEAVLPATMLAWIFLGFFQSVVAYSGVFVAQCHGAGDESGCRASYRAGTAIAFLSGLLMLPLVPLGGAILGWTAATPALLARERAYYDIICAGGLVVFGQMAASSYFTGRGQTRIVFWVNLLGNLLNVALDPILIFGWWGCPRLGIAGAAYATVFANAVQWLVLAYAARHSLLHSTVHSSLSPLHPSLFTFHTSLFTRILRYGIPAGGYTVMNMLSFTIFVFVTGRVGDVAFAASNACFTVNYLLFAPMEGFALGAQTLVGQARGRGDDDGAALACRRTLVLGLGFVALASALVLACHRPILALFAPSDAALAADFSALGLKLLALMSAWLLFDAADTILSGALKGAGDTRFVFILMLAVSFGIWLPLVALVASRPCAMTELWATLIVDVVVLAFGTVIRWRLGRWRRHELVFDVNRGSVPASRRDSAAGRRAAD